jgi:sodium-dependent dicarboxylate transporter 2/3/5
LPLLVLAICLVVTFMTELTSNTATSSIFMPILAGTAATLGVAPEFLMIPATLSASCAFMLPVATPPNAIIFGSDFVTIRDMAKAGLWLNLIGAVLVTVMMFTLGRLVFGI